MKIAIEGCLHSCLDKVYETVQHIESHQNIKVDLLICCGDFQSVRNCGDLQSMAVPQKYREMGDFYKYYSGEKKAPVLTIFIGGNHEASSYLQELPYGGWVAPNIYYLGYANVLSVAGVRVGGLSGIYKAQDYRKGHFEHAPYTEDAKRSAYHIRNLEVFRLKQVTRDVDIFLSHDWPKDIAKYGDLRSLYKRKPFLREDIESGRLGSPPAEDLLYKLKPHYWFSAHLHCKYAAHVKHENGKTTKFLALDKCLPRRQFLQILDIEHDKSLDMKLSLDAEWLTILKNTNHLLSLKNSQTFMPGFGCSTKERYDFTVSDKEIKDIEEDFGGVLSIPENFERTAPVYNPREKHQCDMYINPQTTLLCEMLELTNPYAHFLGKQPDVSSHSLSQDDSCSEHYATFLAAEQSSSSLLPSSVNPDEICIDDDNVEDSDSSDNGSRSSADKPAAESEDTASSDALAEVKDDSVLDVENANKRRSSLFLPSPLATSSPLPVSSALRSSTSQGTHSQDSPSNKASDSDSGLCVRNLGQVDLETSQDTAQSSPSPKRASSDTAESNSSGFVSMSAGEVHGVEIPKAKKFKRRNQSIYTDST